MNLTKMRFCFVLILLTSSVFAQTNEKTTSFSTPPPGNIKILADYSHERKRGIDSKVGIISKSGGITISYDIGRMAGNYVNSVSSTERENIVWLKTQKILNQELTILYLKNGKVYASFKESNANFFTTVKTNEELADFLLTITTYP